MVCLLMFIQYAATNNMMSLIGRRIRTISSKLESQTRVSTSALSGHADFASLMRSAALQLKIARRHSLINAVHLLVTSRSGSRKKPPQEVMIA